LTFAADPVDQERESDRDTRGRKETISASGPVNATVAMTATEPRSG